MGQIFLRKTHVVQYKGRSSTPVQRTEAKPMVRPEEVETMIQTQIPDAQVQVQDLTGGGDHLQVTVISTAFEGKSLVQQHQIVYGAVNSAMASEAIHALALKTYTPDAWAAAHP